MRKTTIARVVGVFAFLLVVGVAGAAKPSSSLTLLVVGSDEPTAAAAEPSYGGQITFDVTTNETDRPFVNVRCYQGATFVYDDWHGFFESYLPEPVFSLAATYWTGEAADCTARLVEWGQNGRERTLMTLSFHVDA
jgi:hypothetical protein